MGVPREPFFLNPPQLVQTKWNSGGLRCFLTNKSVRQIEQLFSKLRNPVFVFSGLKLVTTRLLVYC